MRLQRIFLLCICGLPLTACHSANTTTPYQSEIAKADKECDAISKAAYPEGATVNEIKNADVSPQRGELVKIVDCVTDNERPVVVKFIPNYVDIYDSLRAKDAAAAKDYDKGKLSYKEYRDKMQEALAVEHNEIKERKLAEARAAKDRENKAESDKMTAEIAETEKEEKARKVEKAKVKKEQLEADKEQCDDYGIKRGTQAFSACLIQLDQARQQQAQQQQMQNQDLAAQEQMQQEANQAQQRAAVTSALLNNMYKPAQPPQTVYVVPVSPIEAPYMQHR
jgi:hypothetical protein